MSHDARFLFIREEKIEIDDRNFNQFPQQPEPKKSDGIIPARAIMRRDNRSDISTKLCSPFVTESSQNVNNNNSSPGIVYANKNTVEISEILNPAKKLNSNVTINPTFNRTHRQQQLFYENNSYTDPIVTSVSDDDEDNGERNDDIVVECGDGDKHSIHYVTSTPTEIEVETFMNESAREEQPLRTSTPNSSSLSNTPDTNKCLNEYYNSNATNNFQDEDENILNTSKDTDELTNTSALNQSSGGGCELVGVNDSDSKSCPNASTRENKIHPYNETIWTSVSQKQQPDMHSTCKEKIDFLENQTDVLVKQVLKLQLKVEELEGKLHRIDIDTNKNETAIKNLTIKREPSTTANFEQANSPSLRSNSHQQLNSSTYSRSNMTNVPSRHNNLTLSTSLNVNNRLTPSQYNNTMAKTLKKSNAYASTNSLYAESINSSISPTSNYNQNFKNSTSPTCMSARRDYQHSHTSMLSLNSLCNHSNSTLKKGSIVSTSILNLSQASSSQLAQWPSIGEFIGHKSRRKQINYNPKKRTIEMILYDNLINMRLPNYINDFNIDKVVEPPGVRLKLNWVYGYRGRDCRTNIFYLPTGECVYFVASIVVLYNPEDNTQRHYLGHTESVKCLTVHPNKLIVASGQSSVLNRRDKRPIVRVWNTVSLATLRVIGFNEDFDRSICCLAFSKHDQGATLAVVDESTEHTITLLDWQREENWRLAETNSGHDPVLAIDFHPIDKYSLVAVGRSTINFWDTRGMTMTKKTGLFDKFDKPKYVLCLTFNDLGDTITGDSNGNIIIWPRGANRPNRVIHSCHNGGVFSVLAMKDGTYLSGGRDRRIVEWDENFNLTGREAELPEHCGGVRYITYARGHQVLIGTVRNSILMGSIDTSFSLVMQGHAEATTALAIHPVKPHYLTGGFDNQINLYDTKTHKLLWNKCLTMPATSASFSPNGILLVVGSLSGKWLVIDALNQEILFTNCDGSGTINCVKFSPNGSYFAIGSTDMQIYVYEVSEAGSKFRQVGTCVGHSAPIKDMDWSDDNRYLQSQSMSFELLFWKAANCRPLEDVDVMDDLKWFTQNCTIGFNTIGLWSDPSDSTLINSCDKSNEADLIVSTTDSGNINIVRWPACYDQCLAQKYYGNADSFDFIRFLDRNYIICVAAKNNVTTEWILDKQNLIL